MATVRQMIESLKQFDENAPIEIAITQCNRRYPVAYIEPAKFIWAGSNSFATMRDGVHVRIEARLIEDENTFMVTSVRKKK